ncbi:MAG: hypothetical protein LQ350_002896 [Teloschistes chrysophthalmus]|nr:MAG: hypothetical protein LQ350_002896 [Niorma chrysophthalma]
MSSGRKRVVSSCMPCYTRKQKCPEACVYHPTTANQGSSPPNIAESRREEASRDNPNDLSNQSLSLQDEWSAYVNPGIPAAPRSGLSLAESFGYANDSNSNTLALIRQAKVDVAILILRICSYASQFLPSPDYTLDKIRETPLADVRKACDEAADSLAAISAAADGRGSLIRIQQLAFFGLKCQIEGNVIAFWESLSRAIRISQSIGIRSDTARSRQHMDEIDQEMERRTFCNLYVWDSLLSRQLDYTPFLSGSLRSGNRPQSNLIRGIGGGEDMELGSDAPDLFTERLLQAHLAEFWRNAGPVQGAEYDMVIGEERYNNFCSNYLSQLPPAFALVDWDKRWDKRLPKLPLQRQLLHIAIYDSICWNFRPLLLHHDQERVGSLSLPTYKRVLLDSQKKMLAVAALNSLDSVTKLHALLGGSYTRFSGLVFSTFEAAVVLVYLCMDLTFPRDHRHRHASPSGTSNTNTDPLQVSIRHITRQGCLQAVQGALKLLRMLADVSSMADVGAITLTRLWTIIPETASARTTNELIPPGPSQNQEVVGNTPGLLKPAASTHQIEAIPSAEEIASWLHQTLCEPADLRSLRDFASSMSETSTAVGDGIAPKWPSFFVNPPNLDPQSDYVSIDAVQGYAD